MNDATFKTLQTLFRYYETRCKSNADFQSIRNEIEQALDTFFIDQANEIIEHSDNLKAALTLHENQPFDTECEHSGCKEKARHRTVIEQKSHTALYYLCHDHYLQHQFLRMAQESNIGKIDKTFMHCFFPIWYTRLMPVFTDQVKKALKGKWLNS